jgi:hypothetical protein
MTWTTKGVTPLTEAFERNTPGSVELVVFCKSHVVAFEVRINGVAHTIELQADYEMPDVV